MDERTLTACRDSLKHWRANAQASTAAVARTGSDYCALCSLFIEDGCGSCPIAKKTGARYCRNGPWEKAHEAYLGWRYERSTREAFHAAATEMADFIEAIIKEAEGV